jgi:Alginate lyase/Fibronectin type III domain
MKKQLHFIKIFSLVLFLFLYIARTNAQPPGSYMFNGNGNWNDASNWSNNAIPPSTLPSGYEITIAPQVGGECILNTALVVLPGAIVTVAPGADLILTGNLAPPAPPSSLTAARISTSTSTVNISWQDNSNNETGFKLERKKTWAGTYSQITGTIPANSTSFTDTGLIAGATYYYRILSYNPAGNSIYSNEDSVTTPIIIYPANVLDLTNWKLNLPVDANGTQTGTSLEIKRPKLDTFSINPYFMNNINNTAVIFNANCDGATTSGSGYPRSELREMTNNGTTNASWSSSSGTHIMEIDQVITHLPLVKPHIVVGQIHDASDDIIVFRLEGAKLFMDHNGNDGTILDNNYVLGTRFKVKFIVSNNQVQSYYNDVLRETYPITFSGAYFKAGAYVQSSCKGSKQVPGELCTAYGEVLIFSLTVTHQ